MFDTLREAHEELIASEFTGSKCTHPEMVEAIREAIPECAALFPCQGCGHRYSAHYNDGRCIASACGCSEWQAPDDLLAELSDDEVELVYRFIVKDWLKDETLSECQNCVERWPESHLKKVEDLFERVAPGEPLPSGECPSCGAVCHEVKTEEKPDAYLVGDFTGPYVMTHFPTWNEGDCTQLLNTIAAKGYRLHTAHKNGTLIFERVEKPDVLQRMLGIPICCPKHQALGWNDGWPCGGSLYPDTTKPVTDLRLKRRRGDIARQLVEMDPNAGGGLRDRIETDHNAIVSTPWKGNLTDCRNALQVVVLTPATRFYLETFDPKALEQARKALGIF